MHLPHRARLWLLWLGALQLCRIVARLRAADVGVGHLRKKQRRPLQVIKDMYAAHAAAGGTAYVHCTAGAPPVATTACSA